MAPQITAYYERHRASAKTAIEVATAIDMSAPRRKAMPGDEIDTRPHGYYDDLWWLGAFGGEKPGYIEGYMVCLGRPPTRKKAERLARAITAWYAQHPSLDDRPIAGVLEDLLRAQRKSSAHPRKSGTPKPGS